jgi:RNA polymerase sigma-70 factor (ECF subfamily)
MSRGAAVPGRWRTGIVADIPRRASIRRANDARERSRPAELPEAARAHLGAQLQAFYASVLDEAQPSSLLDLIARLEDAASAPHPGSATAFRDDLVAALPGLRAFALSLSVNATVADDLVQETLLKAWKNQHWFEPGSNLKAWLCTILRNQFYGDLRKSKREVEDADGAIAARVVSPGVQEANGDLRVVWQHLAKVPTLQREALVLVAAQGMTYEAAAELVGCREGTMKSRVSRARTLLAGLLGLDGDRSMARGPGSTRPAAACAGRASVFKAWGRWPQSMTSTMRRLRSTRTGRSFTTV